MAYYGKVRLLDESDIIKYYWSYTDNMYIYNYRYNKEQRNKDFESFNLDDLKSKNLECVCLHVDNNNNIIDKYNANIVKFKYSTELIAFAYNIACWKSPFMYNTRGENDIRSYYKKLYEIFIGVISEAIAVKYFNSILSSNTYIRYYELERSGPELVKSEEYDLLLNNNYMSIKVDSNCLCYFDSYGVNYYINPVIRRPWDEDMNINLKMSCFTQFIVQTNERFDFENMMKSIIYAIYNGIDIDLEVCLLGGAVTNGSLTESISKKSLFWCPESKKYNNVRYIDMGVELDSENYINELKECFGEEKIDNKNIA